MSHEYGIGKYKVEIVGVHVGKSGKKGTPQIEFVFAGELGHISGYRYITEGTWPYLEKELIGLGWNPQENGYEFEKLETALVGVKCEIVTKQESYRDPETGEDKVSLKVQFINGPGRVREEMPEEERKPFLAALRKSVIGFSGKPPKKADPKAEHKARVEQATKDGIANQRGKQKPAAAADPDEPPEPASVPVEEPVDDWGPGGRF